MAMVAKKNIRPPDLTDAEYRIYLMELRRHGYALSQSDVGVLLGMSKWKVAKTENAALDKIKAAIIRRFYGEGSGNGEAAEGPVSVSTDRTVEKLRRRNRNQRSDRTPDRNGSSSAPKG